MHHCFRKQLFGYKKNQVDEYIVSLEKKLDEIGNQYEQRIAEVVEENVRTSVELKVARAGYQDAAEMMYSAQSRIRDLEKLLYEERERVGKLEETLAEKNEKSQQEMEKALEEMKERLSSLSRATGTMHQVLGNMGRVTTYYEDGTCFEDAGFVPPDGVEAKALEEHSARGLMQRIYQIRQKATEEQKPSQEKSEPKK